MKRKFNWKALLIVVILICFAVTMVACKPKEEEPENATGATMEALDALFTALDKTLPKTTEDTSVISASADIAIDTDLVIKTDLGDVALADYVDGLKLSLAANLQENAPEKNVIDASLSLGESTPLKVFSKGSIAYITDGFTSDNAAATPVTYMVDVTAIDYSKYLDDLPGILGKALSGVNVGDLKTDLLDLINGASLGDMLDGIVEAKKNAAGTGYDLRVIVATESDTVPGLAGTVASMLSGLLGGDLLPEAIKPIINDTVIPYVFGVPIDQLNGKTKDDVNEVHITFDTDKTSGAVTSLSLSFTTGKNVKTTSGGLTLSISNLSLKAEENTALTSKAAPTGAVPLGAEVVVDLDLGNDNLDMTATLQVSPSLSLKDAAADETGIKMALKSVVLNTEAGVFDENDLYAAYDVIDADKGQYGLKVDLTALYKAAYAADYETAKTSNQELTWADYISKTLGVYTTQYYFPINIGEFLFNLTSKKYVLVGMNGTGSHGVYEYLWIDEAKIPTYSLAGIDEKDTAKQKEEIAKYDATFIKDIKAALIADTDLVAKIYKAYNVKVPTTVTADSIELVIADRWAGGNIIKYVMAYPTEVRKTITFKNEDGSKDLFKVTATVNDKLADIVANYSDTKAGAFIFDSWKTLEGATLPELVTADITLKSSFVSSENLSYVDVYKYDLATLSYVRDAGRSGKIAHGVAKEILQADQIYGMEFVDWYEIGATSAKKVSEINADTKALYPVYKTTNAKDEPITAAGDKSAIVALMNKSYYSVDVLNLILGNVGTIIDVISTQQLTMDQVTSVVSGIGMLGIKADDTQAVKEEKVANWLLSLLALAEGKHDCFQNYYHNVYEVSHTVDKTLKDGQTDITKGLEKAEEYMKQLTEYTVYYTYLGIYGNLTESATAEWNYGWTADDWKTYSDGKDAKEKAAAYVSISAAQGIKVDTAKLDLARYDTLMMQYINGYIGDTGCTSLKDFLFKEDLSIKLTFDRNATGANITATLTRGSATPVKLDIQLGLIDGREITLAADKTWTNVLDFRAWDMSQIKDLKHGDKAVVVGDTEGFKTAADLAKFATECIVRDGEIVYNGKVYTYNAAETKFQSAAVAALLELNLKMSGQATA